MWSVLKVAAGKTEEVTARSQAAGEKKSERNDVKSNEESERRVRKISRAEEAFC